MTALYSEYNAAEKVEFDKSQYREVDDARIAGWVYGYLNDVIDEEDVSFDLKVEQKVKLGTKALSSYKETDAVNFRNKNGIFTYEIDAKISGQSATIDYASGNQMINTGGKTQTVAQSELEAIAFIKSLMNIVDYKPLLVEDITKTGNNLYKVNLTIHDLNEYKNLMRSLNDNYQSNITYIIVEMDEEEVKSIESYIEIQGYTYTYIATSKMEITAD